MSNVSLPYALCLNSASQRYVKVIGGLLLLFAVGCTKERSRQAELSMKVEPSNRPGVYVVSGATNLPDQSRIIVQGIRPFSSAAQSTSTKEFSNYVILDRQAVMSSQGQWQTTLKLWQSTPDGQHQESWQFQQAQINQLKPSNDVVFIAAIDSASQAKPLAQPLDNQGKQLKGANIRFATDGQWYLQAKQTLTVTPPVSKIVPSALNDNDLNGGSNTRSKLINSSVAVTSVNLPALKEEQTTAALSFSQYLR